MVAYAVMITTTVLGLSRWTSRSTSRPVIPGIIKSTSASAYELRLSASMACAGLVKVSTVMSSRCKARPNDRHKFTSSSSNSNECGISPQVSVRFGTAHVVAHRQRDREHAPMSELRGHSDLAPVLGNDPVADRQAEAEPGPTLLGRIEGIKDMIHILRMDATTDRKSV